MLKGMLGGIAAGLGTLSQLIMGTLVGTLFDASEPPVCEEDARLDPLTAIFS